MICCTLLGLVVYLLACYLMLVVFECCFDVVFVNAIACLIMLLLSFAVDLEMLLSVMVIC